MGAPKAKAAKDASRTPEQIEKYKAHRVAFKKRKMAKKNAAKKAKQMVLYYCSEALAERRRANKERKEKNAKRERIRAKHNKIYAERIKAYPGLVKAKKTKGGKPMTPKSVKLQV